MNLKLPRMSTVVRHYKPFTIELSKTNYGNMGFPALLHRNFIFFQNCELDIVAINITATGMSFRDI